MDTWVDIYGKAGSLCVLVAETTNEQVVGIAPMMLGLLRKKPGIMIKHLTMLGQQADTASEYLDWIIDRNFVDDVANAFCTHFLENMKSCWDLMSFDNMRSDSPVLPIIRHRFGARAVTVRHMVAPFVKLDMDTWDDFLNQRRGKFRQRWRRFHREHKVNIQMAGRDIALDYGLAKIRSLNAARWATERQSFLSDCYCGFHERVAKRLLARNSLLLILMEVDGVVVAGRYDFIYGGKAWSFQSGWLPEWANLSIGKLMIAETLRWCIENGLNEYDFLGGSAAYKADWASESRGMICLEVTNPCSWRGLALAMFRRVVRRCHQPKGSPQ